MTQDNGQIVFHKQFKIGNESGKNSYRLPKNHEVLKKAIDKIYELFSNEATTEEDPKNSIIICGQEDLWWMIKDIDSVHLEFSNLSLANLIFPKEKLKINEEKMEEAYEYFVKTELSHPDKI